MTTSPRLKELQAIRRAHQTKHQIIACDDTRAPKADTWRPTCRWCHPELARQRADDPATEEEWEGAARMAAARQAAGLPWTQRDHAAIDRYPDPGGWAGT